MQIQGKAGRTIPTGDIKPLTTDGTDLGSAVINTGTNTQTFTINDLGSGNLTLSGAPVFIAGDTTDFSVSSQPNTTVTAGGHRTFDIQFAPTTGGAHTATVAIASDDAASPYTFIIKGTGTTAPAMVLKGNATTITNGDDSPVSNDGTDVGSVEWKTGAITQAFTIQNTGTGPLTFTGQTPITLSGDNPGDFTVVAQPHDPIAANGTGTFSIKFKPGADTLRDAVVSIATNDTTTSPYTFSIQGTGIDSPVVQVLGNTKVIATGNTPSTTDFSDFGGIKANQGTIVKTFTIKNVGSDFLNLDGDPVIGGTNAADFAVTTSPSTDPLDQAETTTFQITFTPTAVGAETANVTINSNDGNGAYTFNIKGTGNAN